GGQVGAGGGRAQSGRWVPGRGADFFNTVKRDLGGLLFIAEDLGSIPPDVRALREEFQVPGTRVLQFAFDGHADNPYLPQNYVSNTVVYTGTHDNPTSREWYEELSPYQRQNLSRHLKSLEHESGHVVWDLMPLAWSSVAALAIAPLQDLLNLGPEARMNVPGRPDGNWTWRCTEDMLLTPAFQSLRELTKSSNRMVRRSPLTNEVAQVELAQETKNGQSSPLGATLSPEGVNFSVYSKHATAIDLLLFDSASDGRPARVIRLDPSS